MGDKGKPITGLNENDAGDKERSRSYTRVLGDKGKRITKLDENMSHKYK